VTKAGNNSVSSSSQNSLRRRPASAASSSSSFQACDSIARAVSAKLKHLSKATRRGVQALESEPMVSSQSRSQRLSHLLKKDFDSCADNSNKKIAECSKKIAREIYSNCSSSVVGGDNDDGNNGKKNHYGLPGSRRRAHSAAMGA
jgi:hypothetical protein